MSGAKPPVAFFDMNTGRGVPLTQVHEMLREVVRRLGSNNCGVIEATPPCEHGRYIVSFTDVTAANVFEQIYNRSSHRARRSSTPPQGVEVVLGFVGVLVPLDVFMRRMGRNN